MENTELLNALLSDPEVRKLLVKLSKNENVNTVLNQGYTQQTYYPTNHNNNCYPNHGCNHNDSFGLGGLGILFLIPFLFGGCGGFGGFGGFGRGCGNNNCCYDPCDRCCEFWY
jgi:hypothetical protein